MLVGCRYALRLLPCFAFWAIFCVVCLAFCCCNAWPLLPHGGLCFPLFLFSDDVLCFWSIFWFIFAFFRVSVVVVLYPVVFLTMCYVYLSHFVIRSCSFLYLFAMVNCRYPLLFLPFFFFFFCFVLTQNYLFLPYPGTLSYTLYLLRAYAFFVVSQVNCPFFYKIGACRHGDRCSRQHHKPPFSQTILVQNLYQNPISAVMAAGGDPSQLPKDHVQDDVSIDLWFDALICNVVHWFMFDEYVGWLVVGWQLILFVILNTPAERSIGWVDIATIDWLTDCFGWLLRCLF